MMTPPPAADRPLAGRCILVTRPRAEAEPLAALLAAEGAAVLEQPVIEIATLADWTAVDRSLERLGAFDWLVFSSANGVRAVCDRIAARGGRAADQLARLKLAAIGPATADELQRYGLRAAVVPPEFRAEALADALLAALRAAPPGERRVLLARASRGREVLVERLRAAGTQDAPIVVEQVVVYESRDVAAAEPSIVAALAAGRVDFVTVTSSAIARAAARLLGDALRRARLASISPVTSDALRELGLQPEVEAREYTMPGLVAAIVAACAK